MLGCSARPPLSPRLSRSSRPVSLRPMGWKVREGGLWPYVAKQPLIIHREQKCTVPGFESGNSVGFGYRKEIRLYPIFQWIAFGGAWRLSQYRFLCVLHRHCKENIYRWVHNNASKVLSSTEVTEFLTASNSEKSNYRIDANRPSSYYS